MIWVDIAIVVGCVVILVEGWRRAVNYVARPLTPTDCYCSWADTLLDEYGRCPDYVPADWTRETAS